MARTIKSPLQLAFGQNLFNSYVVVPHSASIDVGDSDSYTIAVWFQTVHRGTFSLTEKWYDDGPPTIDKYPWAIRGPKSVGQMGFNTYDGTNNPGGDTTATGLNDGEPHLLMGVRDFTNDILIKYLDGASASSDSADNTTGDVSNDRHIMIGGRGMGMSERWIGKVGRYVLFSGVVSSGDAAAYYAGTDPSNTKLLDLRFDEGEGLVITDHSGNNNHGIMGNRAVWDLVDYSNLIQNGDLSLAPSGTTATTTTARHLDGTAGGSTGSNIYGWYFSRGGTGEALIDTAEKHSGTHSLKLSTQATASYVEMRGDRATSYATSPTGGSGFPLKSDTSYTLSFWLKTNYTSGDSNDGAYLAVLEANASGSNLGSSAGVTKVKTTQGWTYYEFTFTTGSTTNRGHIEPRIYGHTGTATLIMDAWFDDIVLMETTHPRKLATRSGLATRTITS